jgi:uncharacterized membrane protein YccC
MPVIITGMSDDQRKTIHICALGCWICGIGASLILLDLATPYPNPPPPGHTYAMSAWGSLFAFVGALLVINKEIELDE